MTPITNLQKTSAPEPPAPEMKVKKSPSARKNWLYESLDLSRLVHHQTIIRNLPFVFFLATLAVLYIWNAHYAEKNVLEINQIEKEMNELRWNYMTSQSELDGISKQSEVARRAAAMGLQELVAPPKKIVVPQDGN